LSESVAALNARYAVADRLDFVEGPGGLTVARIHDERCDATVSLSGGHVMTWRPQGEKPVLWLSAHARFEPGRPIRGGIPVCWPWFGPHESEPNFPGHGFARTMLWTVESIETASDGAMRLSLAMQQGEATRALWPHRSSLRSVITAGRELRIDLLTANEGDTPFQIGEALHTYFAVGDVRRARIRGLEHCDYLDKVDGGQRKNQEGAVVIADEVDRVYLDAIAECVIDDFVLDRQIRVRKQGSRSTVIWNPWAEKAHRLGDFGPQGFLGMVCVESGNVAVNRVTVAPGAQHALAMTISVERAPEA